MEIAYASIHGRFQPFHNGHLAYALEALRRTERLYVGLTKVLTEPGPGGVVAPHRLDPNSNPLTYFERVQIVRAALLGAGVPEARVDIGPFPIENPERLPEFWPPQLPCITTVVDKWNEEKIGILKAQGYQVLVAKDGAYAGEEYASGTRIRELIRAGDDRWRRYVPDAAADLVAAAFASRVPTAAPS